MHSFGFAKDVGSYLALYKPTGGAHAESTSSTGTASAWIDRRDDLSYAYQSCVLAVPVVATLAAGETMTVTAAINDAGSSTGSGSAAFSSTAVTYGSTASTASQSIDTVLKHDVNLTQAGRFMQTDIGLAVSSTGDTFSDLQPLLILAGSDTLAST